MHSGSSAGKEKSGSVGKRGGLDLTKVSRGVIAEGDYHEIAAAVRQDGSVPFVKMLEQLAEGMWQDPSIDEHPDDGQASMRRRLLAEIAHLAQEGEPARDYDHLVDGIWEFKIETLRATFYDTPGDGTFEPRVGVRPTAHWAGRRRDSPPEGPDEFVRLGHCFVKTGQEHDPRTSSWL